MLSLRNTVYLAAPFVIQLLRERKLHSKDFIQT